MGKGREGKGREGKGREGKGREGKGREVSTAPEERRQTLPLDVDHATASVHVDVKP